MNIGTTIDHAAKTVLNTLMLEDVQYFYENRQNVERFALQKVAERTVQFIEEDKTGETFVRSGKVFYMSRDEVDAVNEQRQLQNITEPVPQGRDFIVRIQGTHAERFEISYREPFALIGQNKAIYKINTVLADISVSDIPDVT